MGGDQQNFVSSGGAKANRPTIVDPSASFFANVSQVGGEGKDSNSISGSCMWAECLLVVKQVGTGAPTVLSICPAEHLVSQVDVETFKSFDSCHRSVWVIL